MSGGFTTEQRAALLELVGAVAEIITGLTKHGHKFTAIMVVDELQDNGWCLEELGALLPLLPAIVREMPLEAQDAIPIYEAMATETRRRMEG